MDAMGEALFRCLGNCDGSVFPLKFCNTAHKDDLERGQIGIPIRNIRILFQRLNSRAESVNNTDSIGACHVKQDAALLGLVGRDFHETTAHYDNDGCQILGLLNGAL